MQCLREGEFTIDRIQAIKQLENQTASCISSILMSFAINSSCPDISKMNFTVQLEVHCMHVAASGGTIFRSTVKSCPWCYKMKNGTIYFNYRYTNAF